MYLQAGTLDDLLRRVFDRLLRSGRSTGPSRGDALELIGTVLELTNPRARLSRTETKGTLFSCLGEFLWYMSGTRDIHFISHYIPDYSKFSGNRPHGAYGPRIFRMRGKYNQYTRVRDLLRERPDTRRAVIQLFNAEDIERDYKDVPCTCTVQLLLRDG